jgi:EAL domain-containing protein (putative c-di-GMP-specific phosphodiesterase class I)
VDQVSELPPLAQDRCGACAGGVAPPFEFTMAFQPVVDVAASRVYAYEALPPVRF